MQFILNSTFEKRFGNLIWKKRGGIGSFSAKNLSENHEYILVNGNRDSFIYHNLLSKNFLKEYKEKDNRDSFRWMELIGPSQQTKSRRPNLDYGILYDEKNRRIVGFEFKDKKQQRIFFDKIHSNYLFCIKLGGDATWLIGKDIMEKYYKIGLINVFKENDKYKVKIKKYLHNEDGTINGQIIKSILSDNGMKVGMNVEATKQINNLFFPCNYTYLKPKPVSLIKILIYITTIDHEIVLDFFAGSGTTAQAVMKINKENSGRRKYILIEMADYFNIIMIPRLKKICYSFNWKDGKPQDDDGISQIIKYHYLEQYEDTLHNIDFPQEEKGQGILNYLPEEEKSEYLMKYMLKFETEGSPSLLNLKQFTNPFDYRLKIISGNNKEEIVNIDLVETFNYLIGLKINKYRYLIDNNGRKYVFVLGERNYRKVAIVWRPTIDINLEKDKENIAKIINDFKPEDIYINGDSLIENYRPIESEFKSRAGV